MHRMISLPEVSSFSVDNRQYDNDENGMIEVEDRHFNDAIQHGYRKATPDEEARFQNVSILTPLVVASMTRDQLKRFIESREMAVPVKTAEMRAMVQSIADDEQDKAEAELEADKKAVGEEEDGGDEDEAKPSPGRPRLRRGVK